MILKTYTRFFTNDPHKTLAAHQLLHGGVPHMHLQMNEWTLIGIGDVLIVGGSSQSLAPILSSQGPIVVDDLDAARQALLNGGARIMRDIESSPTGRYLYAIHADGNIVEYAEWRDELREKWYEVPRANGIPSAQI